MNLRTYVGDDIRQIMRRIKGDLGDATLVSVKKIKPKGLSGLFKKTQWEVIVSMDMKVPAPPPVVRRTMPSAVLQSYQQSIGREDAPKPSPKGIENHASFVRDSGNSSVHSTYRAFKKDVDELKSLVVDIGNRMKHGKMSGYPPELFEHYLFLINNQVSEELSEQIVRRLQETLQPHEIGNPSVVRSSLRSLIKQLINTSDGIDLKPGRCVKVAFVGPTGVGKTTTISKLFAIYKMKHRKEIGVITNDTQRIGATEQLKRVAQIVGVPVKVAATPADIGNALRDFRNMDFVLIDTAGRCQRNEQKMEELSSVLAAAAPDEIHLVLDSSKRLDVTVDVVKRFSTLNFNKIILTKVDEAVRVGLILDILSKVDKKLSFVTTGQEVPSDIEIADSERLSSLILQEANLVAV